MLKKDDNGLMTQIRVCIDVRKLNQYLLENDHFVIPFIHSTFAQLAGKKIFGEIDIGNAYMQMKLDEQSKQYTAFTFGGQQYMFNVVPFGIKHIPSLFQRYMSQLFHDMSFVAVYIDNICFASDTWEQHAQHLNAIIDRLNSVNMRIKPSSINVGNYQIKLLGHVVSPVGVVISDEILVLIVFL